MTIYRIFLSYSSLDLKDVEFLKTELEKCNTKVFLADQDLRYGEILEDVFTFLGQSNLIIVFWSDNSKNSSWVKREMEYAKQKGIELIPIVHKEDLVIPEYIKEIKYVKYWDPIELDKFKKQIIADASRLPEVKRKEVEAIVEHIPKGVAGGPKISEVKEIVRAAEVSFDPSSAVGGALLALAIVALVVVIVKSES